jgi:hypothetical protein
VPNYAYPGVHLYNYAGPVRSDAAEPLCLPPPPFCSPCGRVPPLTTTTGRWLDAVGTAQEKPNPNGVTMSQCVATPADPSDPTLAQWTKRTIIPQAQIPHGPCDYPQGTMLHDDA